jgi:glycosyltransferase domain-containing protein
VNYTLVIPTFNRPSLLSSLLNHLRRSGADFPVIVLDSSASEVQRQNAVTIAECRLEVSHQLFPESKIPQQKFAEGFHLVQTLFSSLCPDDDILFVEALRACVAALADNPELAVCDGRYISFDPRPLHVELRIEYDGPSVDQATPMLRMRHRLDTFEAATYAVFRTEVARKVFDGCIQVPSPMFWELFTTLAPLGVGKHRRLNCVYMARRTGLPFESSGRTNWHPLLWARDNSEEMSVHFEGHVKELVRFISENANMVLDWHDLATAYRKFFRGGLVELGFNKSRSPVFSVREQTAIERTLTNITNQRKRLVVAQGSLSGRIGISLEVPLGALKSISTYCSSEHYLASLWTVIRNCCYLILSHPVRAWRSRPTTPN